MNDILISMQEELKPMRDDSNIQKLYKYFKNKTYLVLFLKQYNGLIINLKSIELLVNANNIEDALTISRKYLETYFIMMSIIEHPVLVESYVKHDIYIGKKVCKKDLNEVKSFCSGKPDGYLEYGYLEKYVDIDDDFKYTTKIVAEVGNVLNFHIWYKMCNNFVYNNLTSVSVNSKDALESFVQGVERTTSYLKNRIENILSLN
jgi:hypothetical protein